MISSPENVILFRTLLSASKLERLIKLGKGEERRDIDGCSP